MGVATAKVDLENPEVLEVITTIIIALKDPEFNYGSFRNNRWKKTCR
jgi:hypothetical protein